MNRWQLHRVLSILAFIVTCTLFIIGKTELAVFAGFASLYFKISEVSEIIESALLDDEED